MKIVLNLQLLGVNDKFMIIEIASQIYSVNNLKHFGGIPSGPVALLLI